MHHGHARGKKFYKTPRISLRERTRHYTPPEIILYRPNVAAIIRDAEGRVLVCERLRYKGAWQFPQGGLEPDEAPEAGLMREVREEVSLEPTDYRIGERRGPYHYLFPPHVYKKGFHGQEQHYFLLDLIAPPSKVDVATEKPEFQAVQWIKPQEFHLSWLPEMKKEVYRQVLHDFFGVSVH